MSHAAERKPHSGIAASLRWRPEQEADMHIRYVGGWLTLVVATIALGCGGTATDDRMTRAGTEASRAAEPSGLPSELVSPAGAGAGMPNLFATQDGGVLMSWLEPVDAVGEAASTRRGRFALRFATLRGETWSEARTIAEGDDFFVNWADFPVIIESGGTLAAHWLQMNGGRGTSYDIHITRSRDGGETWEESIVPHADGTPTEHGFVSMVSEADGGFSAIWLDGRNSPERGAGQGGAMTLRATRFDDAGNQGPEALLDPLICECCQTSAAYVGDTLVAVYRNRSDEEIRDMWSVRRTADGWQRPVRVSHDDWMIPGCPVNGPSIAASDNVGAVAWFSLRGGDPEVKVTFTRDGGASFTEAILLDSGSAEDIDGASPRQVAGLADAGNAAKPIPLGRVDVAWVDGTRAVVSWIVGRGSEADLVLQTVGIDGKLGARHVVATTASSRASGFPQIVRQDDRLVIAWTEPDGDPSLHTAVVNLSLQ